MKCLTAILVVPALAAAVSVAAPRTWTSTGGRFHVEAELLDVQDGKVQLKKTDGQVIAVPLGSLSAADREHVKGQFPGVEEEQFRPGAEYREWTSASGKFTTLAEFVGYSEGKARLRKPDGSEISVDRKQLSPADQRWLAEEQRRLKEQEKEAPAPAKSEEEPTGQLAAQDIPMKVIRLDPPRGRSRSRSGVPADYMLRLTTPQVFFIQLGKAAGADDGRFRRVVQKEPEYNAPVPLRAVARLGSREYGFALDTAGSRAGGYSKLYFDANGNGDLTDDTPVSATGSNSGSGVSQSQFPRIDVAAEAEGKPVEYAFMLSALCRQSGSEAYASLALYAAAVREGYITEGKKRTRLLLVDHNSNGRFDDAFSIRSAGDRLVPAEGDLLLVDPNPKDALSADATMGRDRHYVSKTVCIGHHFYRMEVSPAGDRLKLTPTQLALGSVSNPSPAYRAVLYSDDYGVLMIGGARDQKIPLPEGTWKVANYTIDASAATGGSRTAVTAAFAGSAPPVAVSKDQTAKLSFGAPFHPEVTAQRADAGRVYLSLAIVGAAGERCTSFYVNGSRPPAPQFLIKDKDGKIVQQGKFEYG